MISFSKSRPASRSRYSCVGRAKQLWLDDAVGDVVAGAGGDVVERQLHPERLDPDDAEPALATCTARPSIERLRVIAGSVRWKNRSRCSRPPRTAHVPFRLAGRLDHERNPEPPAGERRPVDDRRVGVADPDAAAAAAVALGVVDPGEEALVPVEVHPTSRPFDRRLDSRDRHAASWLGSRGSPVNRPCAAANRSSFVSTPSSSRYSCARAQRLEVGQREPELWCSHDRPPRVSYRRVRGARRRESSRTGSRACTRRVQRALRRMRRCPSACC